MEFNSTVVGVIVLLIILVPVIMLIASSSGKNKKIKNSLIELSRTQGVNLQDIDVIGNLVIGIDDASKKLAYSSQVNLSEDLKIINLDELKSCRTKSIRQNDQILDWVGLELVEKNGKREIPFYIETDETGLSRDPLVCLQDAKRWEEKITLLLKAS